MLHNNGIQFIHKSFSDQGATDCWGKQNFFYPASICRTVNEASKSFSCKLYSFPFLLFFSFSKSRVPIHDGKGINQTHNYAERTKRKKKKVNRRAAKITHFFPAPYPSMRSKYKT